MDLNFCSALLKTNISSSAVSSEGYDVANLLSGVPALQSKGFLAEGFCKPPVSIFLKFFCNVDINHIMLWVEVGRQKSNGLELLAAADCDIYGDTSEGDRPSRSSRSVVKVRIGSCKINHESGAVFKLFNGRVSPKVPANFVSRHFNTSGNTVLRNCSELEIKIFSTANSSVPSLKRIEVWGRPGRRCPEDVKQKVYSLWNEPTDGDRSVPKIVVDPQKDDIKTSSAPSTSSDLCEKRVPEEFLDPITLNLMAIPMTLPSGKSVDISTLEKFENAEANWGRGPSDPFTGVPFTQSTFPVPNVALKSRIDQFLVENGHLSQFKGVGRTVGREKRDLNQFAESPNRCGQVSGGNQASGGASSSRSQNHFVTMHSPITCNHSPVPELCHTVSSAPGEINVKDISKDVEKPEGSKTQVQCGLKRTRNNDLPSLPPKDSRGSRMTNHEDDVEDSLDCALQSVLSGLPSFVNTTAQLLGETSSKTAKCECSHCLSKDCLFALPCRHLLCRTCLVDKSSDNSGKKECEVCHKQFNSSDVIRFHNS